MNPIGGIARTLSHMPQSPLIGATRFAAVRRVLVRTGISLIVPSLICLALAMAGILRADIFAIGANGGLRTIAAVAILGCLMAAIGYWDDY